MHPKLATILPMAHLKELEQDEYFLALAHMEDFPEYREFFQRKAAAGKHVILDNSAVELGGPEPFEKYIKRAMSLSATQIMFPDIFKDPAATLEEARKAMKFMASIPYRPMIMVIPQGNTTAEWLENAANLIELQADGPMGHRCVHTVGISYRYNEMFNGNRLEISWRLSWLLRSYQKIHLLGCAADPKKEGAVALKLAHIQGMDSSYPALYAYHKLELTEKDFGQPRPSRDMNFATDEYDVGLLRRNLETWWKACLPNEKPIL